MEVRNIKLHCRVQSDYLIQYCKNLKASKLTKKTFSSFCVLRVGKLVFNCFFNGYVNITGVYNEDSIHNALKCFLFTIDLKSDLEILTPYVIDNITAKCILIPRRTVNLIKKKINLIQDNNIVSVKYNRERFPNMFIKTKFGTIIWSPNNSVSSVGSKTNKHLEELYTIILQIDQI